MKKIKPPKEEQAPAYMSSYAALWCIMLAFFCSLLTLAEERAEKFRDGMGAVRNAFGRESGFGVLPFLRGFRVRADAFIESRRHDLDEPPDEDAALVGFFRNMLWREGLSSVAILEVEVDDSGGRVLLHTPVQFYEGDAGLTPEARDFLNKLGGIFHTRRELSIRVDALVASDAGDEEPELLALRRSSTIVRYLNEECRIARGRLSSLGYPSTRYMPFLPDTNVAQVVLFSVKRERG